MLTMLFNIGKPFKTANSYLHVIESRSWQIPQGDILRHCQLNETILSK